jgi:hypothetical protein
LDTDTVLLIQVSVEYTQLMTGVYTIEKLDEYTPDERDVGTYASL